MDEEFGRLACLSCGVLFELDDVEDFDDVKCPDCGENNIVGEDE